MAAFTLAHLSDPHLPPLPVPRLHELLSKRVFGYLNWTRNRHKYQRREVLDALLSDLHTQRPDHIAVTGDFVNLALNAEFEPARAWLESVGPPDRVSIVPGNHDAYVRATQHRIAQCWGSYFTDDDTPDARFPFLRRRGPLALIGVSSAVPTPPLMATGWLGRRQLDALQKLLDLIATEPLFRILLIHHPLRSDRPAKRLTDFGRPARAAQAPRRRSGPAWARSCPFDDLDRWPRAQHSRGRRALGLGACAWPLSCRRL